MLISKFLLLFLFLLGYILLFVKSDAELSMLSGCKQLDKFVQLIKDEMIYLFIILINLYAFQCHWCFFMNSFEFIMDGK